MMAREATPEHYPMLLRAVLLFHRGGPWTADDSRMWSALTGKDEATTRALCDAIREALGDA